MSEAVRQPRVFARVLRSAALTIFASFLALMFLPMSWFPYMGAEQAINGVIETCIALAVGGLAITTFYTFTSPRDRVTNAEVFAAFVFAMTFIIPFAMPLIR